MGVCLYPAHWLWSFPLVMFALSSLPRSSAAYPVRLCSILQEHTRKHFYCCYPFLKMTCPPFVSNGPSGRKQQPFSWTPIDWWLRLLEMISANRRWLVRPERLIGGWWLCFSDAWNPLHCSSYPSCPCGSSEKPDWSWVCAARIMVMFSWTLYTTNLVYCSETLVWLWRIHPMVASDALVGYCYSMGLCF